MAKQKRRFKKKKKRRICGNTPCDSHHLCYQRRHWNRGALFELRKFHYCRMYIPKDTLHHVIHEFVGDIPAPKEFNARSALEQLRMLEHYGAISDDDPIEKRLKLLAALFDCCDQPTADAFRAQLEVVNKFYNKTLY